MKLLRLTVEHAMSCGGLLDKVDVDFESEASESELDGEAKMMLSPHCLIGQNGSGKSQLLQLLAEVFQSAWCAHAPDQERDVADRSTLFELEYLPRSLYPFAGANLRNLAPMGGKCNRAYKQALDILCDDAGTRRRCFDPYGENLATVSLLASRPFENGEMGPFPLPVWQVDLLGDADSVATWDQVFQIRRRYEGKIQAHFREWMEHFAYWCAAEVGLITTQQEVISTLERYLDSVLQRTHDDGSHLRRAMFEMLHQQCVGSDISERLARWLSALVSSQRQLAVA